MRAAGVSVAGIELIVAPSDTGSNAVFFDLKSNFRTSSYSMDTPGRTAFSSFSQPIAPAPTQAPPIVQPAGLGVALIEMLPLDVISGLSLRW